ncbi:copper resistance protein CopC, partial [Streptococcus agalactiae]|uniref:copper resistance protein CopC n=1 Tax=Streptococcus agalactiae TaxID=1311 RepID=UPI00201C45E2
MSPRVPAVAAILGLQILLSAAGPVLAHVELDSSDPAAGSAVAGAGTVTLVFTEALKEGGSSFKVIGPDGQSFGTGGVVGPRRMALN